MAKKTEKTVKTEEVPAAEETKSSLKLDSDMIIKGLGAAAAVYGAYILSRGSMRSFIRRPLVVFTAGALAGAAAYKYRKSLINSVTQGIEMGKDLVAEQKERLNDLIAEAEADAESGE